MTIDSTTTPHAAILVTDTPISSVTEKFGDFGDNTADLLKASSTTPFPVVKYQMAFEGPEDSYRAQLDQVYEKLCQGIANGTIKGVILTGSRSDSFATGILWIDRLNQFIKEVLFNLENFPIVGICFGHQILALNLGSKVGRNLPEHGWECGTTTINLNSDILNLKDSPFADALKNENGDNLDHLNLVEFHQDVVYGLPPLTTSTSTKFASIGSTAKCSIQGLITEEGPLKVLTFQGHPEFTTPIALDLLKVDLKKGLLTENEFEKFTYHTQSLNNQGTVIGKVIDNFLKIHNKQT
ncbi:class I glutamine amidotransferase-like protein [Scheffersomyces xylosifermentans]|uniref:class I glutamine amidotransferase-like protein n=1 Tax=Scheffersomyces xylosifermentans TaxID=1304137 RepID=UPI00315D26D9